MTLALFIICCVLASGLGVLIPLCVHYRTQREYYKDKMTEARNKAIEAKEEWRDTANALRKKGIEAEQLKKEIKRLKKL